MQVWQLDIVPLWGNGWRILTIIFHPAPDSIPFDFYRRFETITPVSGVYPPLAVAANGNRPRRLQPIVMTLISYGSNAISLEIALRPIRHQNRWPFMRTNYRMRRDSHLSRSKRLLFLTLAYRIRVRIRTTEETTV